VIVEVNAFVTTRSDGRSNSQVVLDLVKGESPGVVFSYEDLATELEKGVATTYDNAAVAGVVRNMMSRLLKEQQRALHNVRGIGYRLAPAREHMSLAHNRKRRADVQMKHGLDTLRHVRWDELDPATKAAHEGTLLIVSALYENQVALERRQTAIEETLKNITQKP